MKKYGTKQNIDYYLDISQEICPLTFVKTKLLIEKMQSGEIVEVRLRGAEPLENVPRSVVEHGHTVLSLEPEGADGTPEGVHLLKILKS